MTIPRQLKLNEFRRRIVAGSFPTYRRLSDAIGKMRFVQADPIRCPARAQDLILRQRVTGYAAGDLEEHYPRLQAEEGYLFAYGMMTPEVWQDLRYRPHLALTTLERKVLESVAELGDAHPRRLAELFGRKSVKNAWGGSSHETKRILEKLHHLGYLRVSRRENGIRVYAMPMLLREESADPREQYCRLAMTTVHVFGPTTKRFLVSELRSQNHLLPSRADRIAAIESLVRKEVISEIETGGITYLSMRKATASADIPDRVRILAPFDPLVRNRERFEQLWSWSYRFEAYVPAAKRERGYYAMPILWRDNVIGWANASVVKNQLKVEFGYAGKTPRSKVFRRLAESEVESMARFLGLDEGAWVLTF